MRTRAMVWIALLAWRSPPRLRRCRFVFPLEAGIGLTPVSAANAAFPVIRCGLSPAVISSWAAVTTPTPCAASRAGLTCSIRARSCSVVSSISSLRYSWRRARRRSAVVVAASTPCRGLAGRQ